MAVDYKKLFITHYINDLAHLTMQEKQNISDFTIILSNDNDDMAGLLSKIKTNTAKISATPEHIKTVVTSSYVGGLSSISTIKQTADQVYSKVSTTDFTGAKVASLINQSATSVTIQANHIKLEGIVTANSNFKVLTDGSIEATNGKFTGTVNSTTGQIGPFYFGATSFIIFDAGDTYLFNITRQPDGTYHLGSRGGAWFDQNVTVLGNVSAGQFIDMTPFYSGDALAELSKVKGDGKGGIDHTSLPHCAQVFTEQEGTESVGVRKMASQEPDGRDLGAMVSVLTKAVQQLVDKNKEQDILIAQSLKGVR